ncbi:2OG-Fe dioxygenase family protein [Aquimarina sp. M1]
MSALVINRQNIVGAESQIYEKTDATNNELIYNKVLAPGEFIFQADTGEEFTFGNDLWHYVTSIEPEDVSKPGIRDIIGFDMDILE